MRDGMIITMHVGLSPWVCCITRRKLVPADDQQPAPMTMNNILPPFKKTAVTKNINMENKVKPGDIGFYQIKRLRCVWYSFLIYLPYGVSQEQESTSRHVEAQKALCVAPGRNGLRHLRHIPIYKQNYCVGHR